MRRRQVLGTVGIVAFAAAGGLLATRVGPPAATRAARVGYLGSDSRPGMERLAALEDGLRSLGYSIGESIAIDKGLSQDTTGAVFPQLAADMLARDVQVIVTSTTPALVAAAQATTTVPIVAAGPHRNLLDLKLIDSLDRPGRNVTGLVPHPGLDGKGVEILHETIPDLTRVGYLYNPGTPGVAEQIGRAQHTAEQLGVGLVVLPVRSPDDIDRQVASAAASPVNGLFVSADLIFGDPSDWRVVRLASQRRLPAVYSQTAGYVDQGGLMAYTSDYNAFHRRAAAFVDKLLHGTRAADLPVEQTTTFDFVINLKAAADLGLVLPESVLLQASQTIR
jgi:putative ABC transport system substrate-binding protein